MALEGAAVTIAEIDPAIGQAAADELTASGFRALFVQTDITQAQQVKAAVEKNGYGVRQARHSGQ